MHLIINESTFPSITIRMIVNTSPTLFTTFEISLIFGPIFILIYTKAIIFSINKFTIINITLFISKSTSASYLTFLIVAFIFGSSFIDTDSTTMSDTILPPSYIIVILRINHPISLKFCISILLSSINTIKPFSIIISKIICVA